jgi:3-methylcrotonyl-CoA carboxylase alpha subunit
VFEAHGAHGEYRITRDGAASTVAGARLSADGLSARFDGEGRRYRLDARDARLLLHDGRRHWRFERALPFEAERVDAAGTGDRIAAPMPGRIVVTRVAPGDSVTQGQEVLVMEAMKMELALKAPRDGVVAELRARDGDFVEADAVLVVLES